jgi:hypothetical protein
MYRRGGLYAGLRIRITVMRTRIRLFTQMRIRAGSCVAKQYARGWGVGRSNDIVYDARYRYSLSRVQSTVNPKLTVVIH